MNLPEAPYSGSWAAGTSEAIAGLCDPPSLVLWFSMFPTFQLTISDFCRGFSLLHKGCWQSKGAEATGICAWVGTRTVVPVSWSHPWPFLSLHRTASINTHHPTPYPATPTPMDRTNIPEDHMLILGNFQWGKLWVRDKGGIREGKSWGYGNMRSEEYLIARICLCLGRGLV